MKTRKGFSVVGKMGKVGFVYICVGEQCDRKQYMCAAIVQI